MGKICLSHSTALMAWRFLRARWFADSSVLFGPDAPTPNSGHPDTRFGCSSLSACSVDDPAFCSQEARRIVPACEPVELLVPRRSRRKAVGGVVLHSFDAEPPTGCLLEISRMLCVVSPELCFIQMAQNLRFEELLKVAFELCGYYSLDSDSDRGIKRCMPLTSRARILALTRKMTPARGLVKARKAALLVADGCASPREAALFALLCFPVRLGGCGLPRAQMNREIKLNKSAAAAFGTAIYVGDMVWPDSRVIVEYDGLADHSEIGRIARDAGRRDALAAEGYTVFVVTNRQICDSEQFSVIAKAVAKAIGYKLRIRDASFEEKSAQLREAFLR